MKKLEDIPKNNPFSIPEGYFDKLPGVIQARIAENTVKKQSMHYIRYALQYAVPVLALIIVAIIYLTPKTVKSTDEILASVSTEQLVAYLADSDITAAEILDAADLDEDSVEAIEAEVYFKDIDLENLNEFDL